ncbi:GTPase, partial [Staphylococcus pasteuri]|uniref:GTPase n=1 Tax=Staphylococcus pasteuri TaxID=45972 RepID=UPI0036F2DB42
MIGRGNVGKCRFVNRVIGDKIGIMCEKGESRGNKIEGVMSRDDGEIIFIDRAGIDKRKHKLGDYMMKVGRNTLCEIEGIMFMVKVNEDMGG